MAAEQQFHTPRPVRLEIKVAAGELEVATIDGESSTVTLEGPESILDAIRVELVGDRLIIEQRRKSLIGFFNHSDGSLRVRAEIPHRSRIALATASAGTTLEGLVSDLEVKSASGGIDATGEVAGHAVVKTVSGEARLERVTGDLTAQTVSAAVAADSVGGSVSMKSVSGDLRVGWLREGSVNVQSVSGHVALGIASGTSIDVDARSASGQLDSEVPLSGSPDPDDGPTLVIRGNTVSGDFRIFRAELADSVAQ